MTNIDNSKDILDVRNIIARFEELETELTEAKGQQSTISEALQMDYTSVEYDGVTYWYR